MTSDFVPTHLRPLVEWRDRADIPNQEGLLIVVKLKLLPCYVEITAQVVRDAQTGLHSLVSYAGAPIDFSRVVAWRAL